MLGIAEGVLSSDYIIAMRREDKELEEAKYRRMFHKGGVNIDLRVTPIWCQAPNSPPGQN
ncbi:hypothetical protein AGMMS50267_01350 [Spirochaetia bacterium]|nr:hypothetical protein AGMMS50267_01350 [Spirochaetia bacterium]